ncbi:MAG: redoxin domain-containing protein [Ignavibacteriales bacterium]|nr:redoxin domain-containing protein [Ignavibacteriales bacterium]
MNLRMVAALVGAVAASSFSFAQDVLLPSTPKIGDELTIIYDGSAKTSMLKSAKEVTAQLMIMRDPGSPLLVEVPLKKSGAAWKGTTVLSDAKSRFLALQFVSDKETDNNSDNSWTFLVLGSDGKPLKNANMFKGQAFNGGRLFTFKVVKNVETAREALKAELLSYPDNLTAESLLWSIDLRAKPDNETKAAIRGEVDRLYAQLKSDEESASTLIGWYERLDQKVVADSLRQIHIAANPKGKVAEFVRRTEAFQEKDAAQRVVLIEKFLTDFSLRDDERRNIIGLLSYAYVQLKQYDKAEQLGALDGSMLNSIAWGMIEKGEELEKGVAYAKRGVDALRSPNPVNKPSYVSMAQWVKSNEYQLGMVLDTYAYGLFQLGKKQEAEVAYAEAYTFLKKEDPDVNARYVEALVANGKFTKAMEVSADVIRLGKSNDKTLAAYKSAYVKAKGSEKGFDKVVEDAKNFAKVELKNKALKDRVNKPAVDFALKNLDGSVVKLSELRGKVVVVDFWATWCGPCKASFPYLQKVYDKYKANPNIVILAVNTWENKSGTERVELVKKFIADNKYTFTVIYDEDNKYVEKYGVEGIPTKFIIDKKGYIQFKKIGFGGGDEMMNEMSLQFELLLSDDFYSSLK